MEEYVVVFKEKIGGTQFGMTVNNSYVVGRFSSVEEAQEWIRKIADPLIAEKDLREFYSVCQIVSPSNY